MKIFMMLLVTASYQWCHSKTDIPESQTRSSSVTTVVHQSTNHKVKTLGFTKRGRSLRLVDDDLWAIMTIAGEALGEPLIGKVAVAEVIRNRMKRRYASDGSVIGTVLRAKQFSMWDDRARLLAASIDDEHPRVRECIEAWRLSATSNVTNGAVLYHTIMIEPPKWTKATSVKVATTIHRHKFYTDGEGA